MTWFYGDTKDTAGMIDLVERKTLFNQHHGKSRIYITWDAASWHGSNKLVEWVNNFNTWNQANSYGPTIEFVPLPSSARVLECHRSRFQSNEEGCDPFLKLSIRNEEMKNAISLYFADRNIYFTDNPKRAGKKDLGN